MGVDLIEAIEEAVRGYSCRVDRLEHGWSFRFWVNGRASFAAARAPL